MRLFVLLLLTVLVTGLRAEEPPHHEIRLRDGRLVEFTAHYDRNALRESVRVGDSLIALTSSGTLLRFELPDFHLSRERLDEQSFTCVGRGEGNEVLAGLRDGRVCRVDPETLELTEVGRLLDPTAWIGWAPAEEGRPAGLVVATRAIRKIDDGEGGWNVPFTRVIDLVTGKRLTWEWEATHFLLDRSGSLWLGADRGEWGGRVTRIDLVDGTMTTVKPPPWHMLLVNTAWDGIYGFNELRDGRIVAHGGSMHMSHISGFIARIDGERGNLIFSAGPRWEGRSAHGRSDPDQPRLPITHLLEEDDGFLVFSYGDILHADRTLKDWTKVADLDLQYSVGRPDAMGSYPSVLTVHPPRRAGDPYIIATRFDGYYSLTGNRVTSHRLPGQFSLRSSADRLEGSSEGMLVFEDVPEGNDDFLRQFDEPRAAHTWRLNATGWTIDPFSPPYELDPLDQPANPEEFADFDEDGEMQEEVVEIGEEPTAWFETQILVRPNGAIFTVSATNRSPGTRTTARWVDGKSVRLGREISYLDPASSFITGDGTLWNAESGELQRFTQDHWEKVAEIDVEAIQPDPPPTCDFPLTAQDQEKGMRLTGHSRLTPIKTDGPPWLLLDRLVPNLWRLTPEKDGDTPKLIPLTDRSLGLHAAIPWKDGSLLFATETGLKSFDIATETVAAFPGVSPPPPLLALTRDGLGRLWVGGEKGLWMVKDDGKSLESFEEVPWLKNSKVLALSLDPHHDDGVIVALGAKGVMCIRGNRIPE